MAAAVAVGSWIWGTTTGMGGVGTVAASGSAAVRESNAHRFFGGSWWADGSGGEARRRGDGGDGDDMSGLAAEADGVEGTREAAAA